MMRTFSPDEVVNQNKHQVAGQMHPFTCPNRGDGDHRDLNGDIGALIATVDGWLCPFCDYRQGWAHDFMRSGAALEPSPAVSLRCAECDCDNPPDGCNWIKRGPASPAVSVAEAAFQASVQPWMMACFGPAISADKVERNHRFLEEALELVQSIGCTADEAHQLVDYVYGRSVGEVNQEVGGVMVTLAALCLANGVDMHEGGETELARISQPAMIAKIRAKQAAKPKHSPLPEASSDDVAAGGRAGKVQEAAREFSVGIDGPEMIGEFQPCVIEDANMQITEMLLEDTITIWRPFEPAGPAHCVDLGYSDDGRLIAIKLWALAATGLDRAALRALGGQPNG